MTMTEFSKCDCGAVTLYDDKGNNYSCSAANRKLFMPKLDLRKLKRLHHSYICNHCVNHFGIDTCACGSGENFWECENGYPECGTPMQDQDGSVFASVSAWRTRA